MPEKSDRELIQETHDAVIELSAVVLGVKGQGGLISEMSEVRLAVKNMTLKTKDGEAKVATLLQDVQGMKPRVEKIESCLFKEKTGVLARLDFSENRGKDNRSLIVWALGTGLTLLLTIIGLIITHLAV